MKLVWENEIAQQLLMALLESFFMPCYSFFTVLTYNLDIIINL